MSIGTVKAFPKKTMDVIEGRVINSLGEVRLKGLKRNLNFCS